MSRTTTKPYVILEIQNEFECFDDVQQAYDYVLKLQTNVGKSWGMYE